MIALPCLQTADKGLYLSLEKLIKIDDHLWSNNPNICTNFICSESTVIFLNLV